MIRSLVLTISILAPACIATTVTAANVSIYKVDPWKDGAVIGGTALFSFLAYAESDQLIRPRCPCDKSEVNFFDRGVIGNQNAFLGTVSDATVAAAVALPLALEWTELGFSKELAEDAMVFAETMSINGSLVTLAKYTVQRPLPRTYDGDPWLVDHARGYRSFYSGHTSATSSALTTAAMTYLYRHPDHYWPWILDGVVTASVAYERVADGRHFYSDVLVGAAAGVAVGVMIPYLHHRSFENSVLKAVAFAPVEGGAVGVMKFQF